MANRNAHYWFDHEARSKLATKHLAWMETHASKQTEESVQRSKIHHNCSEMPDNCLVPRKYGHTEERLLCMDTVSAIIKLVSSNKFMMHCDVSIPTICALNFASFKHPGGAFLKGSCAQEEMLCHESNLYNILLRMEDAFYLRNRTKENLNRSLYQDSLIYTPNVLFIRKAMGGNRTLPPIKCDVITCAAPNASAATRYHNVSQNEIEYALKQRILGIFNIAVHHGVDDLILGAFGCGVFGNDPHLVASIFHSDIKEAFDGYFRNVYYAIPDKRSTNYKAFQEVLSDTI